MIEGLIRPQHLVILFDFIFAVVALLVLWKFISLFQRFVVSLESIAKSLRERGQSSS
jgi:hypothetical protein